MSSAFSELLKVCSLKGWSFVAGGQRVLERHPRTQTPPNPLHPGGVFVDLRALSGSPLQGEDVSLIGHSGGVGDSTPGYERPPLRGEELRRSPLLLIIAMFSLASHALAGVPAYSLVGTIELPAGTASYDTLPDGRLLSIVGSEFFAQDSVNGSTWSLVGSLPSGQISSFGASFVRVSPDGATIAVGDNNFGPGATVYTFASSALDPLAPTMATAWASSNLDAHWSSASRLYIAGASAGGELREIDLNSMSSRIVLNNIGLSAGGVTSDGAYLYAGNGFDLVPGGSDTGEVRAYDLASISGAVSPIDFENAGIAVADALSGASLGFDTLGNMLIGGGDVFGGSNDYGYAAVVDGDAINAALLGGPIAPDASELRLTPDLASHSYFPRFNSGTGEVLVSYFDNSTFTPGTTIYRYAVPAPGAWMLSLAPFAIASRRRRA